MIDDNYMVKSKKIVTVSDHIGTIQDGAMVIKNGKIEDIGKYSEMREGYIDLNIMDFKDQVITPSLVDCHTHVLEYAASSLYPVTQSTHLMGGVSLLLKTLSSGITSLGEQICGHPQTNLSKSQYLKATKDLPIDISFSISTISIGFDQLVHFTGITGSNPVSKESLLDTYTIGRLIELSEYPGENIFINVSPANLEEKHVPRAGEIIYTQEELDKIVYLFHDNGKEIGCHVGGEEAIDMAIDAGFDILHHAHEITDRQIEKVRDRGIKIVATPLGGTHLPPNTVEEIVNMVLQDITLAIASDAYLPPSTKAPWLSFEAGKLIGPDSLMLLANPTMLRLKELGLYDNEILRLITLNPAKVLGKNRQFGSLDKGKDANFLVARGIPGLEITDSEDIEKVFFRGERIIDR